MTMLQVMTVLKQTIYQMITNQVYPYLMTAYVSQYEYGVYYDAIEFFRAQNREE